MFSLPPFFLGVRHEARGRGPSPLSFRGTFSIARQWKTLSSPQDFPPNLLVISYWEIFSMPLPSLVFRKKWISLFSRLLTIVPIWPSVFSSLEPYKRWKPGSLFSDCFLHPDGADYDEDDRRVSPPPLPFFSPFLRPLGKTVCGSFLFFALPLCEPDVLAAPPLSFISVIGRTFFPPQ